MMSEQRKIRIGVTGPDKGGTGAWLCTKVSVMLAGAKAIRITPDNPAEINSIDGLIIGGGADVEPITYGEEQIPKSKHKKDSKGIFEWVLSLLLFPLYWIMRYLQQTKDSPIDKKRDELEFLLLQQAVEQGKPVLGICRGMQLINIHFGGSLYQDVSGFYKETSQVSSILPRKSVLIERDSKLAEILEAEQSMVNALHNQGLKDIGKDLRVVANEELTTVRQGIEHINYPFLIGVQWHPEFLIQMESQRRIFKKLIECAADNCFNRPEYKPV